MPKTRGESIFFTSITAWMMVYGEYPKVCVNLQTDVR